MPDGSWFRDQVLERYDITPAARDVLRRIPVEIEDTTQPRGGGLWYPDQRRIRLNGIQEEACLHELAHAWADEAGFYPDPHPDDPRKTGRHFALRADVERAAHETDSRYRRVAFLAWEYTHGNPATGFSGMHELDWERFAGLASGVMGDIVLMPPYLRRWYEPLFGGRPALPGPSSLPPWAPAGWQQGDPHAAPARAGSGLDSLRQWLERFAARMRR